MLNLSFSIIDMSFLKTSTDVLENAIVLANGENPNGTLYQRASTIFDFTNVSSMLNILSIYVYIRRFMCMRPLKSTSHAWVLLALSVTSVAFVILLLLTTTTTNYSNYYYYYYY